MTIESLGKDLRVEKPAIYRIRVTGHIGDSLSDRLGGVIITRAFSADSRPGPRMRRDCLRGRCPGRGP